MVKRLFYFFNKKIIGLHEAAFILGVSSVFSQVLAIIRDRLFAGTFGASKVLDIYYASFRVPDFLYVLVASLVSGSVLIPFIVEKLSKKDEKDLKIFLNNILTFFALILIGLSVIVFFIIPYLVDIIVPGFTAEEQEIFISMTRILLLSPFLLGLSNLFGSITQAMGRFYVYALSPILYNVGIIVGILFFYKPFGVLGLAYGVVLGALLHFAVQVPLVLHSGLFPMFTRKPDFSSFKHVIFVSLPRTITLSAHHFLILVFTSLASLMAVGSISIFNFAYNLQSVPLAIVGVSYSVAAFPVLSALFTEGKKKEFVKYISTAARHIIFWSVPVLVLFIVLRAQIVRVLLGVGRFGWEETRLVAAALAIFAFSVFAQGLILLFVRGYYAAGNTKKPLYINVSSSIISLILAFVFIKIFKSNESFSNFIEILFRVENINGTEVLMLPFAFSIGAILNLTILWLYFKKDFNYGYVSLRKSVLQVVIASIFMGITSYYLLKVFDDIFDINTFLGIFMQGLLSGIGGVLVGIILLKLIKNKEIKELENVLRRKIFKEKPILPGPEDLP